MPRPTAHAPALATIGRLHGIIDELVAPLAQRHAGRLQCQRGCADCCQDGLTVFEIEAARIVAEHPDVLDLAPHPPGACAFLDAEGACRVYDARPYVCRTQGLPLRWVEERGAEVVELRDICPKNEEGAPLDALPKDDCWALGPVEDKLAALQGMLDRGALRRVALRDLFG